MRNNKGQFKKGHRSSRNTEFKKGQHWRKKKEHWDKEWLELHYVEKQMTAKEIADIQGCTEKNIYYWLKKHKIKTRSMKEIRAMKYWGSSAEENGMHNRTGKENPNWKGGITPERQSFYSSLKWKRVSRQVRKRDKNSCQMCNAKKSGKKKLHVHHVVGFENKELRAELSNLILLCKDCHGWIHSKKNKERRYLG